MIPHTGLPAWPTTSDEEDDHHHHARGCCPRFPHDARDAHERLHAEEAEPRQADRHPPRPKRTKTGPDPCHRRRPPPADRRHSRRLPAPPRQGEAGQTPPTCPPGRGGQRIGRRHAAGLCPAALPATAAGEEGALMTHKYRGCIVVSSISKNVDPNEEQKVLTSSFDEGFTVNAHRQVFRGF